MNKQKTYMTMSIVLLIDQIIKIIINHTMELNKTIKVIPNFFSIYYVKNTGAAFSILKDSSIILIIIATIFILFINKYIKKEEKNLNKVELISLGLVMGGVLGNLIDRIIHKGVIDYLSFRFFGYDFAVFNFADICICVGTIIYILFSFIKEKSK